MLHIFSVCFASLSNNVKVSLFLLKYISFFVNAVGFLLCPFLNPTPVPPGQGGNTTIDALEESPREVSHPWVST